MKLDKLLKQLRRDIAASPKKAAALALMALVAVCFWARPVMHWLAPGGSKRSAASNLILKDDPEEPGMAARRKSNKFRWEKVRGLIAQDARMSPAAFDPQWTDPFAGQASKVAAQPRGPGGAAPAAAPSVPTLLASELDPQQAGLVLTSVLIGPKRRLATISGDTYGEGSVIRVAGNESALAAIEFRVTRITGRGVELERNGKRFALLLAQPTLATGDQIQRTKGSE